MKTSKKIAAAISIILASTIVFSMFPTASAQWSSTTAAAVAAGMKWDFPNAANFNASATRLLLWNRWKDQIPTWTYAVLAPNPVGVGQAMTIVMFNPQLPYGASATNDVQWEYKVKIVKPDGTTLNLPGSGTFKSDSTGSGYCSFTPDQVGNYTVTVIFQELLYRWYESATFRDYYGVTLKESSYTETLIVQADPVIPVGWTATPLPTEYWVRPIEGMNTDWYQIASNWYGNVFDRDNGGSQNRWQTNGIAPNSGHIVWTKPTEDGGLVGGGNFSTVGEVYNAGHQYQTRFTQQIILHGRLYYRDSKFFAAGTGDYVCVDLRTGQEVWRNQTMSLVVDGANRYYTGGTTASVNTTISAFPSFGYQYDWDDMNQHGIANPGWLFTSNFAVPVHPRYGTAYYFNVSNVPSGTEVAGPKGELLRYVFRNIGTTANPNWVLSQWNSTLLVRRIDGNTNTLLNASAETYFDWNVSVPWYPGITGGSITVRYADYNDLMLISNGSHPVGSGSITYHYPEEVSFRAVSLKPDNRGQVLWGPKTYKTANFPDNHIEQFMRAGQGVMVWVEMPYQKYKAYSMTTGELLWTAEKGEAEFNPFGYYSYPSLIYVEGTSIAYDKLFTSGYTGMVFCYDLKTGKLLWRYEAPSNAQIFKYYTLMLGAIADGKIFIGTHEHSADTPLFKGNKIRALDVNIGEEVWSMFGWAHPQTIAIADGTLIYWNNYDHQIYAVAKGPSQTTVEAPMAGVVVGNSIIIRGRVTDISPGTQQLEQAKRFPNGVPAVSDESMSKWMEYVYMQKAFPKDCKGVEVTIEVLDSNGNYREIGKTTSDASGAYSLAWAPDIPGKFTVVATFKGSESYYGSYAETAFAADPAPLPPAEPEPEPPSMTDTYILYSAVAIVAAIAIVGILLALLVKKKP